MSGPHQAVSLETLMAAKNRFERLADQQKPTRSPRALYGKAKALDKMADVEKSNSRLEQAIYSYRDVLDLEADVPDKLYKMAAEKCINRMKFRGFFAKAIRVNQRVIQRFPEEIDAHNQLAVLYLLASQPDSAKQVLETTLSKWPNSGFAKAHLGFILKTTHNKYEEAVELLRDGVKSKEEGTVDGRFYYHLGDALQRLGKEAEARMLYVEGETLGLFLHRDQRSLYNVDRLKGRPWWSKKQTTYHHHFNEIEKHWQIIRNEAVKLLDEHTKSFIDESENLRHTGVWKQFELYFRGRKIAQNCEKVPKTCQLLKPFKDATGCTRGQIKFSIMHPNTHVWPHTGPTNCRIRAHLGLVVPPGLSLRVANETRSWREGEFIIFDDSFEHEVWHNGTSFRLVLIIDVWHPQLTVEERRTLSPI